MKEYFFENQITMVVGSNKKENWDLYKNVPKDSIWIHLKNATSASGYIYPPPNKTQLKQILIFFIGLFPRKNCSSVIYNKITNVSLGKETGSFVCRSPKIFSLS